VSYAELSLRGEYKQSFDLGYNADDVSAKWNTSSRRDLSDFVCERE